MFKNRGHQTGFTLVELLIVIVVIAILAAIGVLAYSGVQQRAVNAAVISDMTHNIKKIRQFIDINGRTPANYQELVLGQFGGTSTAEDSLIGTKREYYRSVPTPTSNNGLGLCAIRPNGAPVSENRMLLVAVSPSLQVFSATSDNLEVREITQQFNDYVTATGSYSPCNAALTVYGTNLIIGSAWYMQPYIRYNADCRCP